METRIDEVELSPSTLALVRGPAFTGDGGGALRELAARYAERFAASVEGSQG